MSELAVESLHIYPIKSCAATDLEEMQFGHLGPVGDREWMVVSAKTNTFVTQRNVPRLALIRPHLDFETGELSVEAPGMEPLTVEPQLAQPELPVEFWKKAGTGVFQGGRAAEWFSDFLHRDVKLLRVAQPRPIKPECRVDGAVEEIGFADGFPLLITTVESLAALNENLERPIPMNRFRPNMVLRGAVEAYDEDFWRELYIGALTVDVVRACARCPIPETDQQTGLRAEGPAARGPVTTALKETRHGIDLVNDSEGNFFGQNAIYTFEPDQSVKVGDPAVVYARSSGRNITLLPGLQ